MIKLNGNLSVLMESPLTSSEATMLEQLSRIDSLVSGDEARALYRLGMLLPPQKRLLEVGSYRGGSTVALGHTAILNQHEVFCIDMWSDYLQQSDFSEMDMSQLNDMRILFEFIENTSFIKDRLFMLRGDANTFSKIMGKNLFALVFIDGAHDYYSVIDDIMLGLHVIEPGGILCGHDYHSSGLDVIRAVHNFLMKSETIVSKGVIHNTSIWYAVIEDPEYELLIAKVIRYMAKGDFFAAYKKIKDEISTVKHTEEIERLVKGLEIQLGISTR